MTLMWPDTQEALMLLRRLCCPHTLWSPGVCTHPIRTEHMCVCMLCCPHTQWSPGVCIHPICTEHMWCVHAARDALVVIECVHGMQADIQCAALCVLLLVCTLCVCCCVCVFLCVFMPAVFL